MNKEITGLCNATLVQEPRKTLSMRVWPDGKVVVKAPNEASMTQIDAFINKKRIWLTKQLEFFRQFKDCDKICSVSGSSIMYLGRQYQLVIEKSILQNVIKVNHNKIVAYSCFPNKLEDIQEALTTWLNDRAKSVFEHRLKAMLALFPNMKAPVLKCRKLTRRWGSYLKKHEIILNPCLIRASKQSIDYVILHELCHVYYAHHTQEFYNLLASKMPQWQDVAKKLEKQALGI